MSVKLKACADCVRLAKGNISLIDPARPDSGYCGRHQRWYALYSYHVIKKNRDAVEVCVEKFDMTPEQAQEYIEIRQLRKPPTAKTRPKTCDCGQPLAEGKDYCEGCLEEFKESLDPANTFDIDLEGLATLQRLARETNKNDPI